LSLKIFKQRFIFSQGFSQETRFHINISHKKWLKTYRYVTK
jgi:hypothetical protein